MADGYDFKKIEGKVLKFWETHKVFEKSLLQRRSAKKFIFFEGPPTANGLPHIGHFLTRVYKDLYGRYKTMAGFFVNRRAGWDTHGLPVELEIEKELGFKTKKDIESYGIDKFNKKAKESVWRYKGEWEKMTRLMGFWIDLDNPYITYDNKYIETLWWIIKKVWDKKLLYHGHKVVPFCPRCGTGLSSHEIAQGYKRITENSVYVKFKIKNPASHNLPQESYFLVWTTTPWTLPGNVALAVGESIKYQVLRIKGKNEKYILAKDRVSEVIEVIEVIKEDYEVIDEIKGKELVGLEYEPLFDFVGPLKNAFKIVGADFVSIKEGTGIVHIAPAFGEDDFELSKKNDLPVVQNINEDGTFKKEVLPWAGKHAKESDPEIINYLKDRHLLFKIEPYIHDYPFCWRCETPLLYFAKNSWFIAMSRLRNKLLKNNQKINWIPQHIKYGRFGEWLKEARDWAISRERFWGTPLPIWACTQIGKNQKSKIKNQSKGCGNIFVAGSLEDLEKYRFKKKNTYYIMRHGHSKKNGLGIISSKIESDTYDLLDDGRKEAQLSAQALKKLGGIDLIISSPFMRTRQTAEIIGKELKSMIIIDDRLKELDHGAACEGQTHPVCIKDYDKMHDLGFKLGDGESWNDVRKRNALLIKELGEKYENKKILLVGHGDPLWLLEAMTSGVSEQDLVGLKEKIYLTQGQWRTIDLKNYPYDELGNIDLHRPFIDGIFLVCPKCGGKMIRVKELVDAWFDSGAMPFAQAHWPFAQNQKSKIKNQNLSIKKIDFPADFIVEAVDQTRGWFYTLLAVSTLLDRGTPYKNVISLGHVLDAKGEKMSKSKGNIVYPDDMTNEVGADAARWYFYTVNQPGEPKSFSIKDAQLRLRGFIMTLWNTVRFYKLYSKENQLEGGLNIHEPKRIKNILDKWILSRLNNLIKRATDFLDAYDVTFAAREIELFVIDDLSNWYLRRSRRRVEALPFLRSILLEIAKIIAPFTPFIAEELHLMLHKNKSAGAESVHLHNWPKINKGAIDNKLEEQMIIIRKVASLGLQLRKRGQIKVRQPLAKLLVNQPSAISHRLSAEFLDLIKDEINVKKVEFVTELKEDKNLIIAEDGDLRVGLWTELSGDLVEEGYIRELIRQIQEMRKEAEYRLDEKVYGNYKSERQELNRTIKIKEYQIKDENLLFEFSQGRPLEKTFDIEREFEISPQNKIWIGLRTKK